MALVIAHTHLTHLLSTLAFAADFGESNRRALSLLMTMGRAISLLGRFDPNSRVVFCQLTSETAPKEFNGLVPDAEYKQLLELLRSLVSETESNLKSLQVGCLCLLLFLPFILIPPFGCMFLYLLRNSFSGSRGKALRPAELMRQITLHIDMINRALAPRGISLVNPCPPDCLNTRVIIDNLKEIEWVVTPISH